MIFEDIRGKVVNIVGAFSTNEANYLFLLADSLGREKVFVEIGSYLGKSSVVLGLVAKENNCDLTCIDIFITADLEGKNAKPTFLKNMESIGVKYTLLEMKSDDAAKVYNEEIDLLFVDGNHLYDDPTYGGVRNDCKFWIPKVKKGGYILFHDYKSTWEGVKRAVDETDLETIDLIDSMIIKQK